MVVEHAGAGGETGGHDADVDFYEAAGEGRGMLVWGFC